MNHESTKKLVENPAFQKCLEIPGFVTDVKGVALPTVYIPLTQEFSENLFEAIVVSYGNADIAIEEMDFQVAVEGSSLFFLLNPLCHMVH